VKLNELERARQHADAAQAKAESMQTELKAKIAKFDALIASLQ
jgi:hypothetical protein